MRGLLLIAFVSFFACVHSQQVVSFNSGWEFQKEQDTLVGMWEKIHLPHTWNADDPFDKEPGYYRGSAWYKKGFHVEGGQKGKRYFMVFEGANQRAEVYINGKLAGSHLGGYTAFNLEITELIRFGGLNEVRVMVNNAYDAHLPPLKGDFNFYGGIYRDVWLHSTAEIHFDFSEYGDRGLFITTPVVSQDQAAIHIKSIINNQSGKRSKVFLNHVLKDASGVIVSQTKKKINLSPGLNTFESTPPTISNPDLWHPDRPNLYQLISEIQSDQGVVLDQQVNSVGFRWFSFDANTGFSLNGQSIKLMGTNRHQDYEGLGNALSDSRHVKDVQIIKEMGSNFFRTAHYPQDPAVINAADQLGLVVSMEIPLDHEITDSKAFLDNSKRMMREMIRQNFNHPSIVVWAYMNEMMLGRKWERDQGIIRKIEEQAIELEKLTREEDPTRYTMIPNHGDLDLYLKSGLTKIPMIVGWNLYFGWYEPDGEGAGKFLDRFHELVPDKPVLITEYGAGADPRIRSLAPERFDFSIEWQNAFHQSNLRQYFIRDFLAGAAIWNVADFGSEGRQDADAKINSKGVVSMDRKSKDAYYLYQSWLRKDPVIHIGSKNWNSQTTLAEPNGRSTYPIDVYSNAEEVALFVNGNDLGTKNVKNHIASWEVPFVSGSNRLEARTIGLEAAVSDVVEINVAIIQSGQVDWVQGISINCGATFHFEDEPNGIAWLPDYSYQKGLWGYATGNEFRPRDRGIGSDQSIFGTDNDPIYQTQRTNPGSYTFEVEPGEYEVTFHWAEVDKEYLTNEAERIFHVQINDVLIWKAVNIREQAGFATAIQKKTRILVEDLELKISFAPVSGRPMINGLQLRKLN